ncbi:hypothetical protein N0V90_010107 [Kalmusia sp. IMI 367209]|nr:hypothetical protein N0V90_010107 [Kalmusia sp. IMI 367209]
MVSPDTRLELKRVARETLLALGDILDEIHSFDATTSTLHDLEDTAPLDPKDCPGFLLPENDEFAGRPGSRIRVFNMDTLDMAIKLQEEIAGSFTRVSSNPRPDHAAIDKSPQLSQPDDAKPTPPKDRPRNRVLVLNMASDETPGGGWYKGSLAQEAAICYRSSLILSLYEEFYPLEERSAIYTPNVLLIREAIDAGHRLILPIGVPPSSPTAPLAPRDITVDELPAISVISVAAIRYPDLTFGKIYADQEDEECMKDKIRLVLRIAAKHGHTKLVLGALGCGVFRNPPAEVALCFLEVIREMEFRGGWFEDLVFAVLDVKNGEKEGAKGTRNFETFFDVLDGKIV